MQECTNSSVGNDVCSKSNFKDEQDPSKYDGCISDKKPNTSCCGTNCQEAPHPTQYSSHLLKIKSEHRDRYDHHQGERPSRYGPDFNELMDESTNELEIDMSDEATMDQHCDPMGRAKEENNNKIDHVDIKDHNLFASRHTLLSGSSKPSTGSAFHPVTSDSNKDSLSTKSNMDLTSAVSVAMSPLGPYPPVGATFVGYPDGAGITSSEKEPSHSMASEKPTTSSICVLQPKPRLKMNEKLEDSATPSSASVISSSERRSIDSPDTMQKEYTILQPANSTSKVNPGPLRSISVESTPRDSTTTANVPLPTTFEAPSTESPQSEAPSKHMLESQRYAEQLSSASLNKGKK